MRKYEDLFDFAPIGYFVWDERGTIQECNLAGAALLGLERSDVRHKWLGKFVPQEDWPRFYAFKQRVFASNVKQQCEFRLLQGERTLDVLIEAQAHAEVGNDLKYCLVTVVDISERKHAERSLHESEERSRLLMDSLPAYISYIDANERYRWVNRSYEAFFCRPRSEIIGRTVAEIQGEDYYKNIHPHLRHAFAGNTVHYQNTYTDSPGALQIFETNYLPHATADGTILGVFVLVFDITDRSNNEQKLRLTQFSNDQAADPIYWIGSNAEILYVNHATCRLLGYSREELTSKTILDLDRVLTPVDFAAAWENLRNTKSNTFQTQHVAKDGRIIDMEITSNLILHEGRELNCAMGRDITARKLAEEALQKSEERYQMVLRGVNDGIWDWNLLTNEEYHSARWNEILGYAEDQLPQLASSFFDLIHPADRAAVDRALQEHFERNKRYEIELRMRHNDGSYRWILSRGEATRDAAGRLIRMVGSLTDIGERKRSEQALRDSELRYRTFIETCADSVFLLDTAGNIRSANPAAARLHGYTIEELLRMNIRDLDEPTDAQLVAERMRRFQAGELLQFEVVHRRKDGSTFPVDVLASSIQIGDEILILAFDRDISERKRSEEQTTLLREELAHTSRLITMSELASGLAHELNQPLAALSLYVGSAVELAAKFDSVTLNECKQRITELLEHTGDITRSMRAFAGRGLSRHEYVNINSLINEVLALLASELKRSTTSVALKLAAPMDLVLADGIQIKQVLVNLIRNAVEAMSACEGCERRLVLCTEMALNVIRVTVTDTGPGLDPEIAKRLFLPFQTTKPDGLGMGLAISRTLIESLGGRIGVQTTSSSGTTFYFEIPRSQELLSK